MPTINLGKQKIRALTVGKAFLQSFYQDARWRRIRNLRLRLNPLCQKCEERGGVVQAVEVHHVIPIEVNPDLAFELDNTMSLCTPCHKIEDEKLRRNHAF